MTTSKNENKGSSLGSGLLNRLKYGSSYMTGSHLQPSSHAHGHGCGCGHAHDDEDEDHQ